MSKNESISYQTIQQTQIYLNAENADIDINGTMKSNQVFFFPNTIKIEKTAIEMRLSLVNAQIPVSWYLINSTNNLFMISINNGLSYTTYYFPTGNYNVNTFLVKFNSLNYGIKLSYDSILSKFTFTSTSSEFIIKDNENNKSLLPFLGFKMYNTYASGFGILWSAYPVNFSGLPRINIKSSSFNIKNIDSSYKGLTRTLCSVPCNGLAGGTIFYNNLTNYHYIFKNHELNSIAIEITDDFDNYIDFNNIDWCITLQIDIVNEVVQSMDDLTDIYEYHSQSINKLLNK